MSCDKPGPRRQRVVALLMLTFLCVRPGPARAGIFDDIGEALVTVTGLRGAIRGLASGFSEGVREQLDRFVDEKVDPLVTRVDQVLAARIDHAATAALATLHALETAMNQVINLAADRGERLTAQAFAELNRTLDETLGRLEMLIDGTLCKLAPGGGIDINLGPFGGSNEIKVKRPARTHCYHRYLAAQGDPSAATFRQFEFFAGELCEYELKLGRIDPAKSNSIREIIAGFDKLAEMANTARCAAPTPSAKAEMVQKLLVYQARAGLLRRIVQGGTP